MSSVSAAVGLMVVRRVVRYTGAVSAMRENPAGITKPCGVKQRHLWAELASRNTCTATVWEAVHFVAPHAFSMPPSVLQAQVPRRIETHSLGSRSQTRTCKQLRQCGRKGIIIKNSLPSPCPKGSHSHQMQCPHTKAIQTFQVQHSQLSAAGAASQAWSGGPFQVTSRQTRSSGRRQLSGL